MNQTHSVIETASSHLPFRSPQSAFDVVEPELVEALSRVSEQLNLLVEQSLNDATPADALIQKLSSQLDEVAGVFSLLGLSVAADLSLQLAQAVERVYQAKSNEDDAVTAREYEALFQCVYLLPRFFEYVQTTGVASPLLLAPCFYGLASAGLSAFVTESALIEFDYQLNDLVEASNKLSDNELLVSAVPEVMELTLVPLTDPKEESEASNGEASDSGMNDSEVSDSEAAVTQSATIDNTEEQQKTFRRLRQMYQTALIGLLRDSDIGAKLVLIDRVAERAIDLCDGGVNASVWRLVKKLVAAFNSEMLELTPQRRHFFTKFDRSLKRLEKDPLHGMHSLPDCAVLAELTLLLLLAEPQNVNDEDLNQLGQFTPLPWNDKALVAHREAMERSTYKALLSMLDVVKDELLGAKRILDMMSESGLCEADDINTLVSNCERISAVLKVSGYVAATAPIDQSLEQINSWRIASPDQEALLHVANMILYIENALLTGSLLESVDSQEAQSTVAKGLLQQAQMNLYEESKSNIGLAKRAVIAYIDSNYDREHIANVGVCLESIGGAFSIMTIENAEILMNRCAVLLNAAYQKNSNEGAVDDWLERLADALVSVEYLLEELAAGRAVDNMVSKLIDDSVLALQ
ncbi:hypothetical protein N9F42_03925 [Pseudomonadales bacterium]|nr:hypothetical protein [Pseudomonadales bacterium]